MQRLLGSGIFILLMLVLDWYVFQALKLVTQQLSPRGRWIIFGIYWGLTVIVVAAVLLGPIINFDNLPKIFRTYLLAIIIGLFLAKFVAAIVFIVDDLRRLLQWGGGKLFYGLIQGEKFEGNGISRSVFLSWLGLGLGGTLFTTLVYGFTNKYKYNVERLKLSFDQLPQAFRGLKIVHISDIHSGSFMDKAAVEKGVAKILEEKPDLILFTGDLVNDRADEMHDYVEVFSKLNAPLGVYSTLGNHDYGDYKPWKYAGEKEENLNKLKKIHADMGWRLLMNEHVPIERNGEKIALLGIENWSAKGNFPKYGKLTDAHKGTAEYPFKILMSHDPSHWDAEVKKTFSDIHLTLSGHTHGMQFGVEIPGFRWSPVQYMYKQWAGLYEDAHQKLYVNRGFGFIGYPGRVGILPEITVIELA
jgi:predicted MPP superfamily phosphohydrolase